MKSNIWDLQVLFEALNKISISKKVPVLFNKHKVRPWLNGMRLWDWMCNVGEKNTGDPECLPLKNTLKWLGFAKFSFKPAVKCFKSSQQLMTATGKMNGEMCQNCINTHALLHYNSIYEPFMPSAAAAAGQAFLFWFYKRREGRTQYWLFKAAKTSSIVKKIPLKSILMPFEENYELAATKLKGYSFKSSSFCHISYSKHQFFLKAAALKATAIRVLYKISMRAGLKIEIII